MNNKTLLLGTTCGVLLATVNIGFAQDYGTSGQPISIPGISKTSGNGVAFKPLRVPLKSTYTASTISKAVVENASPATTAQQILAREPSIYVTSNGPSGVNTNVTFRAFNDGQFSETFDGIGLNDAFNAGVVAQADNDNNTLITTNDFDTVNLYRGINNPAVNAYNSLGGTINYNPRRPSDAAGGEIGGSYGSFNTATWHATLNTGLYHGVKQIFSFERATSDGWTQLDKNDNSNLFYGVDAPLNNGATNIYGSFIYDSSAGLVNQLMPVDLLDRNGTRFQFPASTYIKQNSSAAFLAIVGVTQQLTPEISADIKAFVGENDYSRSSFSNPADQQSATQPYALPDSPTAFPFWLPNPSYDPTKVFPDAAGDGVYGTDYHLYAYYTNSVGVQPSLKWELPFNTVQLGGNLTFSHLHSREYWYGASPVPQIPGYNNAWNEHDYRTLGSLYAQDEISLLDDRLKITPGVKYLFAETKDTDDVGFYYPYKGSNSNYGHYISPTVGASYQLLPDLVGYVAYGQNIKFPDITAYYNNISTSSGQVEPVHAQPEYVRDYEAGLRYERGGLVAEANYYREDFLNTFITTTDPVTGNTTTTNGGKQRFDGEELQLGDDFGSLLAPMVPGDFSTYINFAHNNATYTSGFTDQLTGRSVSNGQPVGNVPNYLVSGGVSWTSDQYYVALDGRYVGREYINNAYNNLATSSTNGGYFVTDLTLAETVPVRLGAVHALRFALNVDNLFGVKYYTTADINTDFNGNPYKEAIVGAPRAIYGSIAIKFD